MMKIFIFPLFAGVLGILSMVQTSYANKENITMTQYKSVEKELKSDSVENSGLTWGLHESLKDCVSCHSNQTAQNSSENYTLIKPVPELCYSCHKDVGIEGQWWHGPVAAGECLLCHEPHKADYKSLLKKTVPQLCYQCHEINTLELITNHTDTSYVRCNDCHERHSSPGKKLLKQNFYKSEAGSISVIQNPSVLPRLLLLDRRDSLIGLQSIKVELTVDGFESLRNYGVTKDMIMLKIKKFLNNNSIKILTDKEQAKASLQIQLRLIEVPSQQNPGQVAALSGSFSVSLSQIVELLENTQNGKTKFCTATTWNTDAVFLWGATQVEDGLNKAIDVLIGQFSQDYILANHLESRNGGIESDQRATGI